MSITFIPPHNADPKRLATLKLDVDPWIKKPLPFKGLNDRMPILVPLKGRGVINQGSGINP